MNLNERKALIESYGSAYSRIKEALADIPDEAYKWRPGPGKWSIHENIIHLADSESNSFIRCRRAIAEPGSGVYGYDQDKWALALDYHSQSTADALELFRLLRKMTFELLLHVREDAWKNTIEHSENGTMTLEDWLISYEQHTHIGQIRRTFDAWKQSRQQAG